MIFWEEQSLNDREQIFEFLYNFNPIAAEKTDQIIESKVEALLEQPLMGVERALFKGRLLIIPEVSMIVSYLIDGKNIRVMRVLHQKQKFPV
ncbi:plasmid stabilization protein ParE [Psychrosphaera saromensis]|uniref:Plasmid stabilization protein ParE n=1 Tax=Psychrosphaera saromensis TaxID=716813 RepID=A0A2S7UWU9_9GAMM|nr:type II toxin-antitoxin system RelE/ParE family toxin [Psychrosphaera saromensis]PQJ53982.1 plasmid stabilization protein ParE [Psychrosphaera saromensis]GHB75902.1 plasmid stabilization protein ParE [Psychrosphaera saromensis]GLQ14531.1 plasmid stabilization protein ParE [Psychrosphaera saromensis]